MKLIVGLGNPYRKYAKTRHNVGFMMLDTLAKNKKVNINQKKFGGKYGEFFYNNEKVILLKPYKYINLSGEIIFKYINYFKIKRDDILIICDDLNLNIGQLKLKEKGSSGGHNGLKNVEKWLGTQNYKRLKIGIYEKEMEDPKDYVLGKFETEGYEKMDEIKKEIPFIIDDYLNLPFALVMNKYNQKRT